MEHPAKILRRMTPTLLEQMLYLCIPFANQGSMSSLLLRTQYQRAVLSKCNFVVWSVYKKRFSLNENWKHTQITSTLHWLAAGADFE